MNKMRLDLLAEGNGYKGRMGSDVRLLKMEENGGWLMENTGIIVFVRFLLDCVPIKLNKVNGIGGKGR